MKAIRILLRVLKLLVGLHDYASGKKQEKTQQGTHTCTCNIKTRNSNEH